MQLNLQHFLYFDNDEMILKQLFVNIFRSLKNNELKYY